MALKDIFIALDHQAERDIADILAEARTRASGIVQEAEVEAQVIREKHTADAESAAGLSANQRLNSARLEARRKLAGVRQEKVATAFDKAKDSLASVRSSAGYSALFDRFVDEALAGVDGEFELLVDPADADLANDALQKRGLAATVRPELSTAGGVVVAINGGRVLRRNTLEDRFEKYAGLAQADIAETLFS